MKLKHQKFNIQHLNIENLKPEKLTCLSFYAEQAPLLYASKELGTAFSLRFENCEKGIPISRLKKTIKRLQGEDKSMLVSELVL